MKRKLIALFIILLGVFFLINLVRSIALLSEKRKIIEDAQKNLAIEQDKNSQLKRELAKLNSPLYVEKEAREKLNMGRAGEYVILLPSISPEPTPMPVVKQSHWEEWARVFWP